MHAITIRIITPITTAFHFTVILSMKMPFQECQFRADATNTDTALQKFPLLLLSRPY
jgi:hypothetical protein